MDNSQKVCYIRYHGKQWEPALTHHQHSLSLYEELQKDKRTRRMDPVLICTKQDGRLFMANFRKINSAIYAFQEVSDGDGDGDRGEDGDMGNGKDQDRRWREVEIMFCGISLPSIEIGN